MDTVAKHDILLMNLSKEVQFTAGPLPIQYACLDEGTTWSDKRQLSVVGFGASKAVAKNKDQTNLTYPVELLGYKSRMTDPDLCSRVTPEHNDAISYCFSAAKYAACDGDSGGPVGFFDGNKLFTLVGIVSAVDKRCKPGGQGIASRVSYYAKWIEESIKEMEKS